MLIGRLNHEGGGGVAVPPSCGWMLLLQAGLSPALDRLKSRFSFPGQAFRQHGIVELGCVLLAIGYGPAHKGSDEFALLWEHT